MLSAFLIETGRIELKELQTPTPSNGELLIKIKTALTCGTDLKAFIRGHPLIPMPGAFGHEFSGIVKAIGKGVRGFKIGDEIMAVHTAPCLKCHYCKKRLYNLCEKLTSSKVIGAFAEYMLLPAHIVKQNVFHKPAELSFEKAAFLEPLSCVVHGMSSLKIKEGDKVLIIGGGPIGLLHLLILKEILKCQKVVITDIHEERLKIAKRLGAGHVFKPEKTDKLIRDITNGIGFDYVFECTGLPQVWSASINCIRRGGTLILFGGCPKGTKVTYDTGRLHYDEITLKGVFHYTPSDVKKAYRLLLSRRLNVERLISGRYSLKDIEKAFNKLKEGIGIKYAIIP